MAHVPQMPQLPGYGQPKNTARNIGIAIASAILVLGGGASVLSGLWSGPVDAHGRKHDERSLDEKVDQLVGDVGEMKSTQKEMAKSIGVSTQDIAVIKRQLGLDGLGPPAPQIRASRIGQ